MGSCVAEIYGLAAYYGNFTVRCLFLRSGGAGLISLGIKIIIISRPSRKLPACLSFSRYDFGNGRLSSFHPQPPGGGQAGHLLRLYCPLCKMDEERQCTSAGNTKIVEIVTDTFRTHVAFFHRTSKQNFIRLSLGRREREREREREGKGSKRRGVASRLVSSRRLASRHVTSRHVTSRHVTSGAQRSNGTNLASGRRFARTIAINRQPIGRHVTHVRTRERGRFFLDRRPAGRRCPPLTDPRNPLFGRNERRDRPREWERDSKRAPRRAGK